jgi:hypothetical protein
MWRLEKATSVAPLRAFGLILVRDRVLSNLGLRGGKIRRQAFDYCSANGIGRHALQKNASRSVFRFGCHEHLWAIN